MLLIILFVSIIAFGTAKENQANPNFGLKKPNYGVDFSQRPGLLSPKLSGKNLITYASTTGYLRFFNINRLSQ
jgi:hypothetical protein